MGDGAANELRGGEGNDTLDGRGGDDTLDGGAVTDTVTYAEAPAGVTVSLTDGVASGGAGNDALIAENLVDSRFADLLAGSALANSITGLGGSDTIRALAGADAVEIRDGESDIVSCGSEIDTATADRQSLDLVDPDCESVAYLAEPLPDTELSFELSGKRSQRIVKREGVVVEASCPNEDCTATATGRGKLQKPKRAALAKLTLKPVTEPIAAGVPERIELPLKKTQGKAVKAALVAGKKLRLKVTVEAVDATGNALTETLSVRARR